MCAVRLRVGCKKLGFLVFMRPVFNSFERIYFLLQCLPSFIIIEYVYEQSECLLLTFFTFVYKYCLQFYDELCIFVQPRACLILKDIETHSIMYLFLFCLGQIFIFIHKVFNCLHKLSMTFNHVTSTFLNYLHMASEGRNTLFTLMQKL